MSDKTLLDDCFTLKATLGAGLDVAVAVKDGAATHVATAPTFTPASVTVRSPVATLLHHMAIEQSENCTIYTTTQPSLMCKGMAQLYGVDAIIYHGGGGMMKFVALKWRESEKRVAAYAPPAAKPDAGVPASLAGKPRHAALKPFQAFPTPESVSFLPMKMLIPDQATLDRFFSFVVLEVARSAFGGEGLTEGNRGRSSKGKNIASILVDAEGSLVAWGVNTNAAEKWRHAEVNTLCGYADLETEGVPDGGTLYTTLEPCNMCAGMIAHLAQGRKLRVVQAMADPTLAPTALTKPPENIQIVATPAQFFLNAVTNSATGKRSDMPAVLEAEYAQWKKSPAGKDVAMTKFFTTVQYLEKVNSARQHWFQTLWEYLMSDYQKKYRAFCMAHFGVKDVVKKVGWATTTVQEQTPALTLGELVAKPEHKAAIEALALLSGNLGGVLGGYDAFLRGVPNALR